MNTKDLITNQEIVNELAESLEDIPQDSEAVYSLWIVSKDSHKETVDELFIYNFTNPEEAIAKAETIDLKFIDEQLERSVFTYCYSNDITCFSVEVETVVQDPDYPDLTVGAGLIYSRDILFDF